jgi:N-methylhydantoinase A
VRIAVGPDVTSLDDLRRQYENEYLRSYGYLSDPETIVVVNLRVTAVGPTAKPVAGADGNGGSSRRKAAAEAAGERQAFFEEAGGWLATPVYTGIEIAAGQEIEGPTIVEFPSTTVVARPGQAVSIDEHRNVIVSNPI